MSVIFKSTSGMTDKDLHYCPGCTHGIIHRLVGEVLEEMGLLDSAIGVAPVGCSVFAYNYFNCDMQGAAHGRAPAVATGIIRALPDRVVFTYQGDGDLAAIGMAETIHAAARGERIVVIFVNNAIYGMTGGQMAPTTLIGQVSTTSSQGRSPHHEGTPIRVCELLETIAGVAFLERVAVNSPANVRKAKKAIRTAFEYRNEGFSLVEILSTCPTNWKISPVESLDWVKEKMIPLFPLGRFKPARASTQSSEDKGGGSV